MKQKAIILDRDGTLNWDPGYVHKVEDFAFLPGVIEALNLLKHEYLFFIISNQSGIGRGLYEEEDFWKFTNHLILKLEEEEIHIEKVFFCPHHPDVDCDCRKPNTKFMDEILTEYDLNIEESWMIGDHPSDVEFGINAGLNTVFLLSGHGEKHKHRLTQKKIEPTLIAKDLLSAAHKIRSYK
ncbi:MAG: D-glycero-alpha-D-manno-heptose-1,7-bisphosphate 7-phosphatase [Promethearchaeota archaeon]|nr:MAG: D-glycero-alpha-D-manno-heptose-1,7-bisphosphate 7-phosphatase [Candidatus Lokiarchaeota archaeon]